MRLFVCLFVFSASKCENFTNEIILPNDAEFIFVKCLSYQKGKKKTGKEFYKNVHSVVPMLPSADEKIKNKKSRSENFDSTDNDDDDRLNVIILGIDSVSRINLKRIMPKTLKYLRDKNWIQLNGYNKIGENTFPNLMAILSRESMKNLNRWWRNTTKKMDDCPIIWKDFNEAGYVTLYAEDTPTISTFNFMRTGFVEKPTDYYMRPFMLAAHHLLPLKVLNGLPVCTGPILVIDHILDYAKKFFKVFNNHNHFSLLWTNSLGHNDLNAPKALDNSVYKFLSDISQLGVYENSLILILSDHGIRFGNIRETFIGYMEERLPFMFIWLPKWFQDKYPEKYNNLQVNQNRLTSPYDVYVTIKNILNFVTQNEYRNETYYYSSNNETTAEKPKSLSCPKSTGLLEVQPLERTCKDACIDENWCMCSEFRSLPVREKAVIDASDIMYNFVVNKTNELIKTEKVKKGLCSRWTFLKIYRAQEVIDLNDNDDGENDNINRLKIDFVSRIFVIIVELNPGRTKFESTVKMFFNLNGEKSHYEFLESPKRLDSIYKTSKCVNSASLKRYCYCVKQ